MTLLREIQVSILETGSDIAPTLLKLRFLASRLGSAPLEEWVRYESEGYPAEADVPEYRQLRATYSGTWINPAARYTNVPIPTHLVEKYAGTHWTTVPIRQSISAVEALASGEGNSLTLDSSNLILLLQGKIYKNMSCVAVEGEIPKTAIQEIQSVVRSRVMELTLQIEKALPHAVDVKLEGPTSAEPGSSDTVTQIFNQTIYGANTTLTNSEMGTQLNLVIGQGNAETLVGELIRVGIPQSVANEFARLVESEKPEDSASPFGKKTLKWLSENIDKAAGGAWNIGVGVAVKVLEDAAMRYYGLK